MLHSAIIFVSLALVVNGFDFSSFGFSSAESNDKETAEKLDNPIEELTHSFWSKWFDDFSGQAPQSEDCKDDGIFPNPHSCNKFYRCEWNPELNKYHAYDFDCAVGSLFDINLHNCELEERAVVHPGCKTTKYPLNKAGIETKLYCIYDLRLSYIYGSPDGVLKKMIGFNGQFPGPTITCTRGKRLIIRLTNSIEEDEPTSLHFHGVEQNLSPFYDGPQSITQCPVAYGTSMIYSFQLFQSGTYWYHSHHAYQYVDGIWGYLVIHNSPNEVWSDAYDEDITMSITDWIHHSAKYISDINLEHNQFPDINSSLINGRGTFDCSKIQPGQTCDPELQSPAIINVVRGKRYRIRVLNAAGIATYNVSIDNHKMYAIETDGVDLQPTELFDAMELRPAHRYSVVVEMNQPLNEYWIRIVATELDEVPPELKGVAILRYVEDTSSLAQKAQSGLANAFYGLWASGKRALHKFTKIAGKVFPIIAPFLAPPGRPSVQEIPFDKISEVGGVEFQTQHELERIFPPKLPPIKDRQKEIEAKLIEEARDVTLPTTHDADERTALKLDEMDCTPYNEDGAPNYYDQFVTLNADDCPTLEEPALMCMNEAPFRPGAVNGTPLIFEVVRGIKVHENYRPIFLPKLGKVIRVAINNRMAYSHPWHLHGHTMWVLGHGEENDGDYDPAKDEARLRFTGVRRDTTHTSARSWAVIQFVTDNPGTWILHCHISWHLEAGLAVTFIEAEEEATQIYKDPPRDASLACKALGVHI